jgi:3-hydroxy-9,10-secoandrosta-1,3,5(10)-triene-9,17-dione monooxygenase reductase component
MALSEPKRGGVDSEDDQELAFRRAMGAFATGVTVVTAADAEGRVHGMTVNSFTSVSLSPRLVLWCLGDRARRYSVFAEAPTWGVAILAASEEALARRFANVNTSVVGADETVSGFEAPLLRTGIAHLSCRTHQRLRGGDHLIIVGEVEAFRVKPGAGLTFYRGRYGAAEDA